MFAVVLPAVLSAMPVAYQLDYSALPPANTVRGHSYTIVFCYPNEPDVRVPTYMSGKYSPQEVADSFWESLDDPSWRVKRDGLRITIYGYREDGKDIPLANLIVLGDGSKPAVRRMPNFPPAKKK